MNAPQLSQHELDDRVCRLAARLGAAIDAVVAEEIAGVAVGALMAVTSAKLITWAVPGHEAALLISLSDYFADMAAKYPVERPQ